MANHIITIERIIQLKSEALKNAPNLPYYNYLSLLTAEIGARTFVELGTGDGNCSKQVASMNPNTNVYTIDTVQLPNTNCVTPNFNFILANTIHVAKDLGPKIQPIDILFMDTECSEQRLCEEYYAWLPYIKPGGLICVNNIYGLLNTYWHALFVGQKTEADDLGDLNPWRGDHYVKCGFGVIIHNNIDISILIQFTNFDELLNIINNFHTNASNSDKIEYLIEFDIDDVDDRIAKLPPFNIKLTNKSKANTHDNLAQMSSGKWLFMHNDIPITNNWDTTIRDKNQLSHVKTPTRNINIDISILIPSIHFDGLLNTIESFHSNALHHDRVEYVIKFDTNDIDSIKRLHELKLWRSFKINNKEVNPPNNIKLIISQTPQKQVDKHVSDRIKLQNDYNDLAVVSSGEWLFVFNDDALMLSKDWDAIIMEYNSNDVYLLNIIDINWCQFPILSRPGYKDLGCIAMYHCVDAWIKGEFQKGSRPKYVQFCDSIKVKHIKWE